MKYFNFLLITFSLQFIFCTEKSQNKQTIIAKTHTNSIIIQKYQSTLYPEMIEVEGGSFILGDSSYINPYRVELSTFYIGKYEITIYQFGQFIKETQYLTQADKDENNRSDRAIVRTFFS